MTVIRDLGKTVILAAAVAVICYIAFVAANATLLLTSDAGTTENVNRAVRHGLLTESTTGKPLSPTDWPIWGHTECLILWMASAPDARLRRLVLPLVPVVPEGASACDALWARAAGRAVPTEYYPRYLHGYRVATALLLSLTPVNWLPYVLLGATCAIPAAGLLLALVLAFRKRRTIDSQRLIGHALVNILFLLSFGVGYFGMLITFAFGDLVVMLFWQMLLLFDFLRISPRKLTTLMATFGAVVAYFEFLTGQIPLSLAMIVGIFAWSLSSDEQAGEAVRRSVLSLVAFTAGCITVLILQQIAIAAVFHTDHSFLQQLSMWTSHQTTLPEFSPHERDVLHGLHLDEYVLSGRAPSFMIMLVRLGFAINSLGLWNRTFALGLLGTSLVLLTCAVTAASRSPSPGLRSRASLIGASLVVLACWYLVFTAHAIRHNLQMARALVWIPMAAAICVPYLPPLLRRRTTQVPAER